MEYQSNIFKQVLNQQSPPLPSGNNNNGTNGNGFSNLFNNPPSNTSNRNNSSFSNIFKEITGNSNSGNSSPPVNSNNIFIPNSKTPTNSNNIFVFNNSNSNTGTSTPPNPNIFVYNNSNSNVSSHYKTKEDNMAENLFSRNSNKTSQTPIINIPIEKESPPLSRSLTSISPIYTATSNSYIYNEDVNSEIPLEYQQKSKSITIQETNNISNNDNKNNNTSTTKSHKRFFSTSSLGSSKDGTNNNQSSEPTTAPSSPKTALFKSKFVDKVLTSVKNISPQVDNLLSQFSNNSTPLCSTPPEPLSVGSNRSNNSNNSNNNGNNNYLKPSDLFPSQHKPQKQHESNNIFMVNSTDSSNSSFADDRSTGISEVSSLSSSSQHNSNNINIRNSANQIGTNKGNEEKKALDFYSYYGNNLESEEDITDSNINNSSLNNEDEIEVDMEFGIGNSSTDITFLSNNSQTIPIKDVIVGEGEEQELIEAVKEDLTLKQMNDIIILDNFVRPSPTPSPIHFDLTSSNSNSVFKSSTSSFGAGSNISKHSNRAPTLNLPYKSKLFDQVSIQQNRSERLLFSIPILESNHYPSINTILGVDDDEMEIEELLNEQLYISDLDNNNNNNSNDNNSKMTSLSRSKIIKAIREDINLQRLKPLPPTPNSKSSDMYSQRFKPLPPLPNHNNNKLSNILQLLSISIPNTNQQTNNDNVQYHSLSKSNVNMKYKEDLNQYLFEYGDKLKILQHINWHLEQPHTNIEIIKLLGTHYGFPENSRALSWKLINDYIPLNVNNRSSVLLQKRSQYKELIKKYYKDENKNKLFNNVWELLNSKNLNTSQPNPKEKLEELLQQVHLDVIRTRPDGFISLFEHKEIEKMMERVLVIWSLENADVSYFQGLNDLLVPFLLVFLDSELLHCFNEQSQQVSYPMIELVDMGFKVENRLGDGKVVQDILECGKMDSLARVEADMYWCISNLLSSVKHYAQNTGSGLPAETLMKKLEKLVKVSNQELYQHFQQQGLDFSHFSFRWMVCFLTREFDIQTGIELWDRYMCDKNNEGFSLLHICFCAALLDLWTDELLTKDFMELVQFLQKPPSLEYKQTHLDVIFRNAIHLKETFRNFLIQ